MKKLMSALAAVLVASTVSYGASLSFFTGPQDPSQLFNYLNTLIRSINSAITPQSMAQYGTPRNMLDNGGMLIQQRGTGIQTGGTTTVPSTAYSADRWGCNTNVTSGAGRCQVTTTVPAPPAGFTAAQRLYRTSGVLTQPVCIIQEVATARAVSAAGQPVTLSFYAQALAGLSADNGNVITANVLTGTVADEGLGSFTASPATTPAWTGIATPGTANFTITTSWVKYTLAGVPIPAAALEIGVQFCFTPTATGAGTTDGFAFTGVQLEQGGSASTFEFRRTGDELREAQRYYLQFADNQASTFTLPATCAETTSGTVAACTMMLPQTMRVAPTSVVTTATSFGMTKAADGTAGACSTLAVIASSNTLNSIGLTCALSETAAVGTMHRLIYANSGAANTLTISSDF